jgi:hypothetical protein
LEKQRLLPAATLRLDASHYQGKRLAPTLWIFRIRVIGLVILQLDRSLEPWMNTGGYGEPENKSGLPGVVV